MAPKVLLATGTTADVVISHAGGGAWWSERWPDWLPKQQMPLGLDLRGGAHLLLAMDQDEIKKDWFDNLRDITRKSLRDVKIGTSALGVQGGQLTGKLVKPEDMGFAPKELPRVSDRDVPQPQRGCGRFACTTAREV